MKNALATCLILALSAQPLRAQESQQIQPIQTEQKVPEKKSWWTSTKKKIVFGLSAVGAAAVVVIGGLGYKEHKRRQALNEAMLNTLNVETMEKLLKEGADPNTRDRFGWPLLSIRVSNGSKEMIELLLRYGADVNGAPAPVDQAKTPLALAIGYRRLDVIPLLLNKGADITKGGLRDQFGGSLLENVVRGNHPDILRVLIETKPEIANVKWYGHTSLWHAYKKDYGVVSSAIIKILEDAGAKVE